MCCCLDVSVEGVSWQPRMRGFAHTRGVHFVVFSRACSCCSDLSLEAQGKEGRVSWLVGLAGRLFVTSRYRVPFLSFCFFTGEVENPHGRVSSDGQPLYCTRPRAASRLLPLKDRDAAQSRRLPHDMMKRDGR